MRTTTLPIVAVLVASCGGASRDAVIELPDGPPVEASTSAGRVSGRRVGQVAVFLGIPYAAAPVGALRWKPPRPAARWIGTRDATRVGPVCPQVARGSWSAGDAFEDARVIGDEDCLSLNVWTRADGRTRPVMVFVHGGGFQQGSAAQASYDATSLATEGDVVVVTFDYRLGVFGMLAHESLAAERTDGSAGNSERATRPRQRAMAKSQPQRSASDGANYAIRDQLAALAWVRDNIARFGGDPRNVTVFGESAGGASVCALVASPASSGLFARAIVQSGGACGGWPTLREGLGARRSGFARGADIVRGAGCERAGNVAACLRGRSATALVRAGLHGEGTRGGAPEFRPILDGVVLVADTETRLREGASDVSLMVGANADEGSVFAARMRAGDDAQYAVRMRALFGDHADAAMRVYPARSLGDPHETLVRALGETIFVCPAESLARAASSRRTPAFLYHFTRRPTGIVGRLAGAFHGVELTYLFDRFQRPIPRTETDARVVRTMQRAWTSFARTGAPRVSPPWPPYRADAPATFVIDSPPTVAADVTNGRCARLREAGIDRLSL